MLILHHKITSHHRIIMNLPAPTIPVVNQELFSNLLFIIKITSLRVAPINTNNNTMQVSSLITEAAANLPIIREVALVKDKRTPIIEKV
jgi:hypothetical protein